ncbi:hypothetical protein [Chitinophaga sp.]|uniref:hypothetical protein n=1 Tax=Chitinophaga sp. TaxID=1869181 RepID=UPI002F92D839
MNWKVIVGCLIILGVTREFISVVVDYSAGKFEWPWGVEIGCIVGIGLGILGIGE